MTTDHERWAETLEIERQHGPRCFLFVAERIGALALANDIDGIGRFREIAARLAQLRLTTESPRLRPEDLNRMTDEALLRALGNISGEPDDPNAEALRCEIKRRGLNV